MDLYYDTMNTPIGLLTIEADNDCVLKVLFDWEGVEARPNTLTDKCKLQLEEYFEGDRTDFDIPVRFQGTAFQEQVWNAVLSVPFGATATYGEQARHMNKPKAVRAVGSANGRNKLAIIVPCHRIIGADASLTGYGGGMHRKKWLLEHEQKIAGH